MIQSLYVYNYSLPNESVELNGDDYPLHTFETSVEVRSGNENRAGGHGTWVGNTWYGQRTIHMEGTILGNSSADYIIKRKHLLRILTPKSHIAPRTPMGVMDILWEGMDEKVQAEFTLDSYPELPLAALHPTVGDFQIGLKCFDPRMYTVEKRSIIQRWPLLYRSFPLTYPKSYLTQQSGNWLNSLITNSGDIETYPKFQIQGPCVNPVFQVNRDTEQFDLFFPGLTVADTEYLNIDFREKTAVVVNDMIDIPDRSEKRDVYNMASGTWWTLEPGENLVTLYYDSTIDPGSGWVFWKDAYMF